MQTIQTAPRRDQFRIIPAVYLLLFRGTEVLLAKRTNTGYEDGNYGVIAGHVDGNETLRVATAREADEEAGLRIAPDDVRLALVMHRLATSSDPPERMDFFMRVDNLPGEPVNKEPHKCSELTWFDLSNLPSNTIPYIKYALEQIAAGVNYCEYGW